MSFAEEVIAMHAEVFDALGAHGVFTPREGDALTLKVILDEVTHNVGELAGATDPRPSVTLPVALVGPKPRGTVVIGTRSFEIDRNVDGDNDGHVVRVFVRELEAV